MTEVHSSFLSFSDDVAALVESTASSIVTVHGGGRWLSGVHWPTATASDMLAPATHWCITVN